MGRIIADKVRGMNWKAKIALVLMFTLVFSSFMYQGWYNAKSADAIPTANGKMFYSVNTTAPQYRDYAVATNLFGAQTATQTGAIPTWMVMKAAPNRNEMIAGYVTTGGVLYIYRWNGTAWINETSAGNGWGATVTVGGNGVDGRRFDIAYENSSGKAVVVYSGNSAANDLYYRTWDGSAWSAATVITSTLLTQVVSWVKLVSRPGASNEITLGAGGTGSATANTAQLSVMTWSGSAWGNQPTALVSAGLQNTTGSLTQIEGFDIAYESTSGDRLIAYTQPAATTGIYYRTYNTGGNALGAATSMAAYTSPAIPRLSSDLNSDQILILYSQNAATNIYGRIWSGTALGASTTLNTGATPATTATWAIEKRQFTGAWLRSGSTSYPVAFWQSSTATTMNYRVCTNTATPTWAAAGAITVTAAAQWIDARVDPLSTDTLMLPYSDSASDLFVERVVVGSGGALTITSPDGGTALTATTLTNITTQNFDFAYDYKRSSTINSCAGCHDYSPTFADGTARNTPAGQFPGSHGPHVQNAGYACSVCHIAPATTTPADFGHRTGTIQMKTGATGINLGYYDKNSNSAYNAGADDAFSVSNSPTLASCRNVNCHATGLPGATVTTPTWGTGPSNCTWCHGDPPTTSPLFNHSGVSAGVCASCHGHNGSGALHANGTLDGTYTCTGCHGGALGTRSAIGPEFGLAYGHKKTGRGAVADADCIVCHLEGVFATGQRSATYHQNGNVDLRDPDGAGETPITNISGGAFTFTKFAISYAAGSRTSTGHTSNTDVANVITQKFCLACHDSNGATNTTARSNNGGTGTATMPFGGINLGANYTVLNGAAVAGGLINAKTQFATTNSSVHPVMGPRTKDFPTPARLNAPYNNFTRVGTSGTKTAGVVLNCFDCHTSGTALTTRTIAAHGSGGTAQVRGTFYVTSPSLCIACHYGYNGPTGSNSGHGAGSAGQWNGNNGEAALTRCMWCHSSTGLDTAAPARPRPAADYHGFNARTDGTLWPTTNSKPYAFIRSWTGTAYHRPFRGIGELTTGSATCGNGTCPGNGQVGDGSTRTYTPGGSY